MTVWALWHGPTGDMRLVALYESREDAQQEKNALMNNGMHRDPPPSCSLIAMDTIPARVSK